MSIIEFEPEIQELLTSLQMVRTLQSRRPYSRADVMLEIGIRTKWGPIHFVFGHNSFAYSGIHTWDIIVSKETITSIEKVIRQIGGVSK